ncbi:MAG: hypothetical protein U0841_22265 [Chloroflexia bacterium]
METDADNNSALRTPHSALRIGLALSSGGARGFAHVGVIKALREAGFTIAEVAAAAWGSIMAAGYAIRADIGELERRVDFRARDHMRRVLPVMDPARITAFLDDILGGAHFADAVPLAIVATDLQRRAPATLNEGPWPWPPSLRRRSPSSTARSPGRAVARRRALSSSSRPRRRGARGSTS